MNDLKLGMGEMGSVCVPHGMFCFSITKHCFDFDLWIVAFRAARARVRERQREERNGCAPHSTISYFFGYFEWPPRVDVRDNTNSESKNFVPKRYAQRGL